MAGRATLSFQRSSTVSLSFPFLSFFFDVDQNILEESRIKRRGIGRNYRKDVNRIVEENR